MLHDRRRITVRSLGAVAVLTIAAAMIVGCRPEPAPSPESTGTPTPSIEATPTAQTPTPIETQLPDAAFEVPAACEDIYSAAMLDELESETPPLNHPGVTMVSTQDVDLIGIIDGGAPTMRCSWGPPSERGLATNVTAVNPDQAESIVDELTASGFACEALGDGTICSFDQKGVTLDDEEYSSGEIHFVGSNVWVSTAWINYVPEGYTEDIVQTITG